MSPEDRERAQAFVGALLAASEARAGRLVDEVAGSPDVRDVVRYLGEEVIGSQATALDLMATATSKEPPLRASSVAAISATERPVTGRQEAPPGTPTTPPKPNLTR